MGFTTARQPLRVLQRHSSVCSYATLLWLTRACLCAANTSGATYGIAAAANSTPTYDGLVLAWLSTAPRCIVGQFFTEQQLTALQKRNCQKVQDASAYFQSVNGQGRVDAAVAAAWDQRIGRAKLLCNLSSNERDKRRAASLAVDAWGQGVMGGGECCNMVNPPYCVTTRQSLSVLAVGVLLGVLLLLFAGTAVASCLMRPIKLERQAFEQEATLPLGTARWPRVCNDDLYHELKQWWLKSHCLRALPHAEAFADASATAFALLHKRFDFQADSVRNQYEHLLSLWRSHCATVADRAVQQGIPVDEESLVAEALGDLHAELLDGFRQWRNNFHKCKATAVDSNSSDGGMCATLSRSVQSVPCHNSDVLRQIAEVAAYLLVWGEAGNVRFMPEVLYFVAELLLVADMPGSDGVYGDPLPIVGVETGTPFQSNLFLAKVVRPIYNVVFDELYDCVEVDKQDGKDLKKMRRGFDTYLPPDAANYDDWNEFFCDPQRLSQGLVLDDGSQLFDKPHGHRFAMLHRVDWATSLNRYETKTHREVHSLWGVFASTHRVWLLHAAMFGAGLCLISGDPQHIADGAVLLQGNTAAVRFAAIGLLVPAHGVSWAFARWLTTSQTAMRSWNRTRCAFAKSVACAVLWGLPLATYAYVRYLEYGISRHHGCPGMNVALTCHFVVSISALLSQLLAPGRESDRLWELTAVRWHHRCLRYLFWVVVLGLKFILALTVLRAVTEETVTLDLVRLGREPITDIVLAWHGTSWSSDVLEWSLLWLMSFFLFVTDTGVWYQIACTALGVALISGRRHHFALEDSLARIPERFSHKVLQFSVSAEKAHHQSRAKTSLSPYFPVVWDRIIEHMRYEDKCDDQAMKNQSFNVRNKDCSVRRVLHQSVPLVTDTSAHSGVVIAGHALSDAHDRLANSTQLIVDAGVTGVPSCAQQVAVTVCGIASGASSMVSSVSSQEFGQDDRLGAFQEPDEASSEISAQSSSEASSLRMPELFHRDSTFSIAIAGNALGKSPNNTEMRWRIKSLARCLGMPMPRPFRAPYVPGITVLIPHFREDILALRDDLYNKEDTVPLIDWVKARYADEFQVFLTRMQATGDWTDAPSNGSDWTAYSDQQWDKICMWSSMRLQTLWRTVAGMSMYHSVLQCHYEAQADEQSALARGGIWNPSDCFTCLVSMQLYSNFSEVQFQQTNAMLVTFPDSLKVAFIDWKEKNVTADADSVHVRQKRRYFSCLIDRTCQVLPGGRRHPRLCIELPGFPILGDGKSDNQNHAIPFMRGAFCQCIDSNQGAYFEQMMLLPCVLGEFRTRHRGENQAKRIIGLPEHITSDFGSVGDFAAGSELAFGTVLQRSHAALGARMHYGHPDIMNKQYMMQQGGVSKATKTLNLSEDIFAGMDFMLRGDGRKIRHCEYFYLTKGRDLGFNAVMSFFSKISSGAGEQVLTRQMFRLGQIMPLPESLSFYYAHAGYYLTQAFISWSMPVIISTWLLVLAADCETTFKAFMSCPAATAAEAMAVVLSAWCSWVLVFFLVAQALPLFTQVWMEMGLKMAILRFMKQWATCSWCFFIFQAKLVGHSVMHEIRYGGATYISTGRGLPTQRSPFIGKTNKEGRMHKVGGLYLDYATHTFYDGMKLMLGAVLVRCLGGIAGGFTWTFIGLTIFSWLYAPFLFNPYQFSRRHFNDDLQSWWAFFFEDGSRHWVEWYDRTQLKPRRGFRHSVWDITCFIAYFVLSVWFSIVSHKASLFSSIYSTPATATWQVLMLCPPINLSAAYCLVATVLDCSINWALRLRSGRTVTSKCSVSTRALGGGVCEASSRSEIDACSDGVLACSEEVSSEDASSNEQVPANERHTTSSRPHGIPLALSAAAVVSLEVVEALVPFYSMLVHGWHKGFVAGIILKILLFSLVLFMAEGVLKCRYFGNIGVAGKPVDLFVHTNRMARDLITSTFIFWTLAMGTLVNVLNEAICPRCNLHQLLIYRAQPLRPGLT